TVALARVRRDDPLAAPDVLAADYQGIVAVELSLGPRERREERVARDRLGEIRGSLVAKRGDHRAPPFTATRRRRCRRDGAVPAEIIGGRRRSGAFLERASGAGPRGSPPAGGARERRARGRARILPD